MTSTKSKATKVIVTAQVPRNWLREAISDREGLADMAYLTIGALAIAAMLALSFIFAMSAYDYIHCLPTTVVSKGDTSVASVVPCRFDPLPVGQAAGLIFGAFATLIAALSAYMSQTRRKEGVS